MARLQIVNLPSGQYLTVIDQATPGSGVSLDRDALQGCAGVIVSPENLEFWHPEMQAQLPPMQTLLGVVEPAVQWNEDSAAEYFKSGWDAHAADQARQPDPDLKVFGESDPYTERAVQDLADGIKETETEQVPPRVPITLAQMEVIYSDAETLEQVLAYAVAAAGQHAQYGPGIHTPFDSQSASAIVDWAAAKIRKMHNQ